MTYYKYAERDATSQVNWADVSKKFSDEIGKIGVERDKKRAEIDKATDELVTKINEAPLGQHKNANLFTSQLVDQTTEDTLRMNKLLKSGDIKPSEYMNYIENQKSSVTGLYDMVTDYQSVYTDKMKRMQDGDSLAFEWEGMAAVEGFGNFANTTPVIDMYGNVTMVNDDTGETMSVAEQRAITKQYFNAYDIDGAMEKQKDQLGQYLTVEMTGNTKTIDDVRRQDGFIKYMDDLVAETLEGPLATSTILLKDLPGYSTSFSPGNDPNKVLTSILDPRQPGSGAQVPLVEVVEQVEKMDPTERRKIFSENADIEALIRVAKAQREDAKQWAKKDLNFRLDRIETARQEFASRTGATDTQIKRQGVIDRTSNAAGHWMNLAFAPTAEQKTTSARALQGLKFEDEYGSRQTIVGVDPLTFEDRVVLTLRDADGNETTVDRVYADSPTPQQWVSQGNFFYEDPSIAEAFVYSKQRREEGPLYGDMTLGVRSSGAALAEEVVDIIPFGEATIGTGKSAASAPVYFQENSDPGNAEAEAAKTTAAVKAALGAMGVDASNVTQITEAASEEFASGWDYAEQETIRFHIPGVTPQSIFVPNNQAGINALADIMGMLPDLIKNREQLTVEQALKMFSSVPKFKDYNGKKFGDTMRKNFGITEAARPTSSRSGGGAGAAQQLYTPGG